MTLSWQKERENIPKGFPNPNDDQYWGYDRRDITTSVFYIESYLDDVDRWFSELETPKDED